MTDEHNNIPENNGGAKPRGFTSKKNLIFLILVAVLTFAIGGAVLVAGVSNSPENRLSRHMRAAERYLAELDYERAVIEYQRVLEIDPMNVDAILGLADAYIGLGDTEKAVEVLRDGLERTGDARIKEKLEELEKPAEPPVPPESEEIPCDPKESQELSVPSESEENEPVFGSMGSVNICGVDIDVATTTSLLIYNKEEADKYGYSFSGMGEVVYISSNLATEDIKKISQLSQLKGLTVAFAGLSDVKPLSDLTNLIALDLPGNTISDISPLATMTNLRELMLSSNKIRAISPLAGMTNLTRLELFDNDISDISPLANMKSLKNLTLFQNPIDDSDIEWLQNQLPNCTISDLNIVD